ncbi:MAG: LysR family carnitine catabolism transcriptional activator [Pseudohongiellaceae bacterium]|jgi:LysR family carnitine catabolism transcriptional activator
MNDFIPKGITIKQLKAFAAITQTRSFAEACELLHLSQPALSIAIKNLEQGLGGRLLERSTRTVTLTPEGEAFHGVVTRLLGDWDQALGEVHNLFTMKQGRLSMAAMPSYASSLLPLALKQYRQCYPDINIAVDDVIAESVVDLVRSGRVELGVTFEPGEAEDLHFEPLFTDKFVAVLPKNHDLLRQNQIKWQALQRYDFIALQKPSSIRMLIDQSLEKSGVGTVPPAFEAHQLASIGRMVVSGLGVSVVPALTEKHMLEMGAECRPMIAPAITRNVGVISRHRHPLSVAAQAMIAVLKQQ